MSRTTWLLEQPCRAVCWFVKVLMQQGLLTDLMVPDML
jgi:hypothetical protein